MKKILTIAAVLAACNGYAQIKVIANGRIGFNTENPAQAVDIRSGQVHMQFGTNPVQFNLAPSHPRILATSKIVFYNTAQTAHISIEASSFNTVSDERLKTNIQKLSENTSSSSSGMTPLEIVTNLNGYVYDLKEDITRSKSTGQIAKHQVGFLAQEVERLIPEAVTTTSDSSELKTMSYNQIIPYLVEAIKEQQILINDLQKRLADTESNSIVPKSTQVFLDRRSILAKETL